MSKLLAALVAAMFALGTVSGFAADAAKSDTTKKDEPKKEAKKDDTKKDAKKDETKK
jgi:Ni/Co efflux regulator RcnB